MKVLVDLVFSFLASRHIIQSLYLNVPLLAFVKISFIGFRKHPTPIWPQFSLIRPSETLFPNKITFWVSVDMHFLHPSAHYNLLSKIYSSNSSISQPEKTYVRVIIKLKGKKNDCINKYFTKTFVSDLKKSTPLH